MADANEKIVKRREREPITLVCFVVFIVACAGVLSAYAYDNYIADNSEGVVYGDTFKIDYTGSLYGYYDEATDSVIPVVFDTTVKDAYDSSVLVAGLSKDSFETTSITLGQGKFLKAFENAIIGKDVGDTVKVKIAAADAYPAANTNVYNSNTGIEFNNGFTISLADYKTLFNKTEAPAVGTGVDTDKNRLPAKVTYDGSQIIVTYTLEKDHQYTIVDNKVGKVIMTPTSESGASKIVYTLTIENTKSVSGTVVGNNNTTEVAQIEMVSFDLFGENYNIVGYDSSTKAIVYNAATSSGDAIHNMDLYFVIKIVSKS